MDERLTEALKGITSYDFLKLIGNSSNLMEEIRLHIIGNYLAAAKKEFIKEEMEKSGLDPDDEIEKQRYIRNHLDLLMRSLLLTPTSFGYEELVSLPGFEALIDILGKTQNVNRSNVSAVLVVAARRSEELREAVERVQSFFRGDIDEISAFFKLYFESVKGWNFNKMNRKEGEKNMLIGDDENSNLVYHLWSNGPITKKLFL